jgi:phosphoglycolate phosphatase
VSDTSAVSLVCCDVLGAAAIDGSLLERAFAEAIATQGLVAGTAAYTRSMVQFDRTRGWPPATVLRSLFPDDEIRAQVANLAFEHSFQEAVDRFCALPLPGANEALAKLTAAGIKVCLVSSLSRPALNLLVERLDWWHRADLVLCADDVARGFPWPDLVLTAVLRLGIGDVREVAVVTATESGVLAARRSGAGYVVGMLSDVDDTARFRRAGVTHLLADIGELPDLMAAQQGSVPLALTTAGVPAGWPLLVPAGTWQTWRYAGTAGGRVTRRLLARARGRSRHRAGRRGVLLGAEDVRPAAGQPDRPRDHRGRPARQVH